MTARSATKNLQAKTSSPALKQDAGQPKMTPEQDAKSKQESVNRDPGGTRADRSSQALTTHPGGGHLLDPKKSVILF